MRKTQLETFLSQVETWIDETQSRLDYAEQSDNETIIDKFSSRLAALETVKEGLEEAVETF